MAEQDFYGFINNNPLYVHNKLEPFLSTARKINEDIKFNFLFENVIGKLRDEENRVYRNLSFGEGNGEAEQIEIGKKRLENLEKEIYSDNQNRKQIFNYMLELFGKVDSKGNPLTIQSAKSNLPIGVNYQERKDKQDPNKKVGVWTVKKGSKTLKENSQEAQQIVTQFCNNWNNFVQQYDKILTLIQQCIQDGTIDIKEGERFKSFRNFLEDAKRELGNASKINYSGYTTLGDGFNAVIRAKVGQWGDIIGFFNEVCKFELDDKIDKRIKEGFNFKRGDDISAEEKGSDSNFAKADNIIVIKGTLLDPTTMIPVSLKFSSIDKTKIQTSSLRSVVNKIGNEPEGGVYANYLKYLLVNNAYFGKEADENINSIIRKILQRYIYLFFSGGLNDSLMAKALFMSSTMVGDNGYSSHFFSIASFLENLKKIIEKNEKILEWEALRVSGFSVDIKTAEQFLSKASAAKQLLRTTEKSREKYNYSYGVIARDDTVREVDSSIFDKLSSLVGSKGIFIKNDYIINYMPKHL